MKEYSGKNISILEGLSAIRKRPGMYIGDTGEKGLHHCVYEVLDNSTDEASAGHGKKITLTKLKNGGIRVSDEGRGIPVDIHPTEKISAATVVLTILHAGGKFDKESYAASGGLHGVGIKATNATSKYLKLTVYREGKIWEQEFEKGEPLYALKPVGETKKTGTTMEFIPDDTIFDNVEYKNELLINRLKTSSFLTKGIEFIFVDETTNEKYSFLSENGIKDFIDDLIPNEEKLTDIIEIVGSDEKRGLTTDKITGKQEENGILEKLDVNVAIQYEKGFSTTLKSYVNKIFTPGGGVHEQGVLDALSSSILKKVKETKVVSKKDQEIIKKVNTEDIKEGLVMVIALTLYTDITFEGQTKEKLGGQYIRGMVREIAKKKIEQYLEENPLMTEQIVKKVIAARRARESADRARKIERKEQSEEIGRMLGKLADCKSNNPDECELYIVEGESSGGSTKQGRDRYYQAILPLKGKPINPLKAEMKKILDNDEIVSLKTAMGCGFGEDIDISKIRYKKIIIMSDADIDGSHILQLLLTVFHTLFRPVLEAGYIYRAVPPLHRVKIGQDSIFLNTDKEKKDYLEKRKEEITKSIKASKKYKETENKEDYLEKEIINGMKKYVLTRFKGLGEMNPEQLWETTMDPEKRYLIQLKPEDIYDITNEFDLEEVAEDINEEQQLEILNILKRRKKEQEKKGELGTLPEINIDLLINLISGAEGVNFREKFLTRNIEGVVHE